MNCRISSPLVAAATKTPHHHYPSRHLFIRVYPTDRLSSSQQQLRYISTSPCCFQINRGNNGADLHSLYYQQMKEIESERDAVFGPSAGDSDSDNISQLAKVYNDRVYDATQSAKTFNELEPPTGDLWDAEIREEAYKERETLFQFSQEEKNAWSNYGGVKQINASQMHLLRQVIREGPLDQQQQQQQEKQQNATQDVTSASSNTTQPFSHLNHQGNGVSMVDVSHKPITRRIAMARSTVIFPPEVLSAFQLRTTQDKGQRTSEIIGPKGPIFETAKIAGIMAAKKTSDMIPLCHPLPLDRVNINIQLIENQAIIECECRVTNKTGVEMEALMGASVAALTIYDMVKAVSHRVEIASTVLVGKSGGKSDFRAN